MRLPRAHFVEPAGTPPGFTAQTFCSSDAEDEVVDLQSDIERAADALYTISRKPASDLTSATWRAELRRLVLTLNNAIGEFG